jgi:alpha-tubulin suppressor-like RCC1 family protein
LTNWKQVTHGGFHSTSIKTDGTLWTWGVGDSGPLGLGGVTSRSSPVQVGSLTNWKQAAVGEQFSLVISSPDLP